MKWISIVYSLILFAIVQFSFAQNVGLDNNSYQLINAIESMNTGKQQSIASFIKHQPRQVKGSYYVFDNWDNKGFIYGSEGSKFKISNINVNIKDNFFEARINQDSIFKFDAHSIDYFLINNRKFKNVYIEKYQQDKICEVVLEDENFTIYKVYKSELRVNNPDPLMLKPNTNEFIVSSRYFIKKGENLEKFKLNKKYILNLFPENKEALETYVKENKLSYARDENLKMIYFKSKTL
ncbi:hypothetical protein [uncultured Psychroserpens sp.]|uniref:hypothetical protein n=1 Tax=uncultured Psychroserpens sp. TaxID=255436 RepID=UPI0026169F2E|nr:hypothetical protein [uncultured Psychroserpens sp.]